MSAEKPFITRFAPSPNGWLHLGHAYSALIGARAAEQSNGTFLLRIEDIDVGRARAHFVDGIYQDLEWLGISWPRPVMVQSTRFVHYEAALARLREMELVYPCWATRREILAAIEKKTEEQANEQAGEQAGEHAAWPRDPDGAPLYPGLYRDLPDSARKKLMWEGTPYCWRLDMQKALAFLGTQTLRYTERADGTAQDRPLDPSRFGDVVLARKDVPTSYHLSVVVDDAAQNISQVTRGEDLQSATAIHVLLQKLLGLPQPDYLHHELVRDTSGRRLSKQAGDGGFRELRQQGMRREEVTHLLPPPFGTG